MNEAKKRVLIVDDILDVAEGLRDLLVRFYEVEIAQDALEAKQLYDKARDDKAPFDVAILDVNLGSGMNGLELADRLRASDSTLHIIVISAYDCGHDTRQRVIALGGQFLEKTVTLEDLQQYIEGPEQ